MNRPFRGINGTTGGTVGELRHPSCGGCEKPILIGEEILYRDPRQKPAVASVHGIRPSVDDALVVLVPYGEKYASITAGDVIGHTRRSCLEKIQTRSGTRGRAA